MRYSKKATREFIDQGLEQGMPRDPGMDSGEITPEQVAEMQRGYLRQLEEISQNAVEGGGTIPRQAFLAYLGAQLQHLEQQSYALTNRGIEFFMGSQQAHGKGTSFAHIYGRFAAVRDMRKHFTGF